jgi:hypothetical protein
MVPSRSKTVSRLAALILAASAAACSDAAGPQYGRPSKLIVVSGDDQVSVVAQRLSQPIVVRVADDQGRAVPNVRVDVEPPVRGAVLATTLTSDDAGLVRVTWVLGTIAGTDSIIVRLVGGAPAMLALRATARPDVPATLRVVTLPTSARNGAILVPSPAFDLVDQFQNTVAARDVPVTARVVPSSQTRTLRGVVTVPTGADGRATFSGLSVVGAVGNATIAFEAPGVAGATAPIAISAGSPASLDLVQPPSPNALAGGTGFPLMVRVFDESGNVVSGAGPSADRVTFALGDGTVLGQAPVDSVGVATLAKWTVPKRLGDYAVVISVPGVTPLRHPFTVRLGPPATVTMTELPSTTQVDTRIAFAGIVADSGGNPVPNAIVSWETSQWGGKFDPEVSTANEAGFVRGGFTVPPYTGTIRFRARLGPITTGDFSLVTTAGPFGFIGVRDPFVLGRVGSPFSVVVGTYDRYGNDVPNIPVSVRLGRGDGTITPMFATTGSDSRATFSGVIGSLPGPQDFFFESNTRSVRVVVTASGDRGRAMAVSATSFTVPPGTSVLCQLMIYDANGFPAINHRVTYTLAPGNGALVGVTGNPTTFTPSFIAGLSWSDGSTAVDWRAPSTPGTYTMTAQSAAPNDLGSPITFQVTVRP